MWAGQWGIGSVVCILNRRSERLWVVRRGGRCNAAERGGRGRCVRIPAESETVLFGRVSIEFLSRAEAARQVCPVGRLYGTFP